MIYRQNTVNIRLISKILQTIGLSSVDRWAACQNVPSKRLTGKILQTNEIGRNKEPDEANQVWEKAYFRTESCEKHVPVAKALIDSASFMPGLKSRPISKPNFYAACKAASST
jgi:hypothetical protein